MRSSARCTKNGASPTAGLAHNTAWPRPERRWLTDVDAGRIRGQHAPEHLQQVALALLEQQVLEFAVGIEMIFDGALGRAGDEHQAARTGGQRLFHRILNEWLVDDGQHLLGAGLGGRQEAGSSTGNRENGDVDAALLAYDGHMGSGPIWGRNHTTPPIRGSARAQAAGTREFARRHTSRGRGTRFTTPVSPVWLRAAAGAAPALRPFPPRA